MTASDTDTQEQEEYRSKTVHLRFLGQFTGALTGATFLAVLGVIGHKLIEGGATAAVAAAGAGTVTHAGVAAASIFAGISIPWAVGLFAVGLACAYLSTSYYQKAQILDTDYNAKKIAAATGKKQDSPETETAVAIETEATPEKPKSLAPLINTSGVAALDRNAEGIAPETAISPTDPLENKRWSERIPRAEKIDATSLAAANDDMAWGDLVKEKATAAASKATLKLAAL